MYGWQTENFPKFGDHEVQSYDTCRFAVWWGYLIAQCCCSVVPKQKRKWSSWHNHWLKVPNHNIITLDTGLQYINMRHRWFQNKHLKVPYLWPNLPKTGKVFIHYMCKLNITSINVLHKHKNTRRKFLISGNHQWMMFCEWWMTFQLDMMPESSFERSTRISRRCRSWCLHLGIGASLRVSLSPTVHQLPGSEKNK